MFNNFVYNTDLKKYQHVAFGNTCVFQIIKVQELLHDYLYVSTYPNKCKNVSKIYIKINMLIPYRHIFYNPKIIYTLIKPIKKKTYKKSYKRLFTSGYIYIRTSKNNMFLTSTDIVKVKL